MQQLFGLLLLSAALINTAWVEWSIFSKAGLLWGLLFSLFLIPFALFATIGLLPKKWFARD